MTIGQTLKGKRGSKMNINKDYISTRNTSGTGNPCKYIVIHETDNTSKGAGARKHAEAQSKGHLSGMSVHYYCGSDGVFQAAEHTRKCWHVGKNYVDKPNVADASNSNTIGIEICVNSDGDYTKARQNAIELVKHLIKTTGIPTERVIRHYDAKGKYCPRKMMDDAKLWNDFKTAIGQPTQGVSYYRVRKAWTDEKSQLGAYTSLDNAKASCPVGYFVFDESGNVVYTPSATVPKEEAFIENIGKLATEDNKKSGILASITIAQAILESGYGTTDLAVNANNLFGMKCMLSKNDWPGSTWDGVSKYTKETKEQDASGNETTVTADFRKYPNIQASVGDHSAYLLGAKNGSKLRYEGLTKAKTYQEQITIIKNGGYATDVKYIDKICDIIERWNLTKYDVVDLQQPVKEGWVADGDKWKYQLADDTFATNEWKLVDGKWYHFAPNSDMQIGWIEVDGKWYFLDRLNGDMKEGWLQDGTNWFFLKRGDGAMQTGWLLDGETWYFLQDINPGSGTMLTGWIQVKDIWYFLEESGVMAANKWIGEYYVQEDGAMAVNQWIKHYVGPDGKWIPGWMDTLMGGK